MIYTVKNIYNIGGESRHRNFERAVKARDSREGAGWMIVDDSGTCLAAAKLAREGGGWDIVPVPGATTIKQPTAQGGKSRRKGERG